LDDWTLPPVYNGIDQITIQKNIMSC